jgi:hypothetical protein
MSGTSTPKRPYRIDPRVAYERARIGARARNSPDCYIGQLERASLTDEQKRRIAVLIMPFLVGGDAAAGAQ